MKTAVKKLQIILLIIFCISACNKSESGGDTIRVTVLDENNNPLSGAIVTCSGNTATTASNGIAELSGVTANDGRYNVVVESAGFFDGYRNILKVSGANYIGNADHFDHAATVKLIAMQNIGTTNANSSNTINGTDFRLILNGGGFSTESGGPVSGTVTVYARYISAGDMSLLSETMPGGDFAAMSQGGEEGVLESYGFTAFEFRDAAGNRVVPNTNAAQVAITVPQEALDQINTGNTNVWYFNNQSFNWSFGGDVTPTGNEIFMPVTSSTFGNCDRINAKGIIKGHMVCDTITNPSDFTTVVLRGDYGYAMEYTTTTNGNGDFQVEVGVPSSGGNYTINALNYSDVISVSANQTTDIGTVDICALSGQDGNPRFNLRWTANVDLDLYVLTPTGETISYTQSMSSDGGELDIDCTCSCNSENIFWGGNGPSGTYTYWVDYFGDCDGSAPPANFTIIVRNNNAVVGQVSGTVSENGQSANFTYTK
jgi:hypothetical protein